MARERSRGEKKLTGKIARERIRMMQARVRPRA